jgi:hypothetical protein
MEDKIGQSSQQGGKERERRNCKKTKEHERMLIHHSKKGR